MIIIGGSGTANGITNFSSPATFASTLTTQGNFTSAAQGINYASLPTGSILQIVNYQTGALATGTTTIPYDDTIPQITEGDQYMSLSITPKSATSKLKIDVVAMLTTSASAGWMTVALFQDTTANALAATTSIFYAGSGYGGTLPLTYFMTSGTTSSTTFKVRLGCNNAGTTSFNGQAGLRIYGGSMNSSITITEIAA